MTRGFEPTLRLSNVLQQLELVFDFKLFYFSIAHIYLHTCILNEKLSDISIICNVSISLNSEHNTIKLVDTRNNTEITELTFETVKDIVLNLNSHAYQHILSSKSFIQFFKTKTSVNKLFEIIYKLNKERDLNIKRFSEQLQLYIADTNNQDNLLYKIFDSNLRPATFDDIIFKYIIFGTIAYTIFKENMFCNMFKIDTFSKQFSL